MENTGPSSRRATLRAAVQLTGEDVLGDRAAYTANVSETGMFVALQNPPPVGSWLLFEMAVGPGPEDRIRGMGTVAWTRAQAANRSQPDGIGFEFRFLSGDGQKQLSSLLSRYRSSLPQASPPARPKVPSRATEPNCAGARRPTPLDLLRAYRKEFAA